MDFKKDIEEIYFKREDTSMKGDFGRCLLIGGSKNYPNAILISASLASVSGNGYTAISTPSTIYNIVASKSELKQIFELSDCDFDYIRYEKGHLKKILKTYDSILFGNGLIYSFENKSTLISILESYEGNLIIDATGIDIIKEIKDIKTKARVLLTPHLGEARRLLNIDTKSRDYHDYLPHLKDYIKKTGYSVLLKSSDSILVTNELDVLSSNASSTPSLAKAGSGDGLAGLITGLLSYADKKIGYYESILFADKLIHEAAKIAEHELSMGFSDILTAKDYIVKVINQSKY